MRFERQFEVGDFQENSRPPVTKRYTFLKKRKMMGDLLYVLRLSVSVLISVTTYLKLGNERKEVTSVLIFENCRN
jgi:hypothetical protein